MALWNISYHHLGLEEETLEGICSQSYMCKWIRTNFMTLNARTFLIFSPRNHSLRDTMKDWKQYKACSQDTERKHDRERVRGSFFRGNIAAVIKDINCYMEIDLGTDSVWLRRAEQSQGENNRETDLYEENFLLKQIFLKMKWTSSGSKFPITGRFKERLGKYLPEIPQKFFM